MSILSAIGNTPLTELTNLNSKKPDVKIFGKLEAGNPGGSVKDRAAYQMIKRAEESGELTKGKITLEPTSGSTGIALAMIGAAVAGALRIAREMSSGTIVSLLPDRGDRYLGTMLLVSVCAKCPP
jgi:cysteine synthase